MCVTWAQGWDRSALGGNLQLGSSFCLVSWPTPFPSLRWSWGEGEAFLAGILGRRREKNGERKLQA